MSLFISCPVEDVDRATAFYSALGWTRNAEMSGPENACFAIAPDQFVMLSSRAAYASVGGTEDLVGGPDTPSKVTVSFDLGSREAVDDLVERAGPPVVAWATPTSTRSCTSASSTTRTGTTGRRSGCTRSTSPPDEVTARAAPDGRRGAGRHRASRPRRGRVAPPRGARRPRERQTVVDAPTVVGADRSAHSSASNS